MAKLLLLISERFFFFFFLLQIVDDPELDKTARNDKVPIPRWTPPTTSEDVLKTAVYLSLSEMMELACKDVPVSTRKC